MAAIGSELPFDLAAAAGRLQAQIGLCRLLANVVARLTLQRAAPAAHQYARELRFLLVPSALQGDGVEVQQIIVAASKRLEGRLKHHRCVGQGVLIGKVGTDLDAALQRLGLHGAVHGGQIQLLQLPLAVPALRRLIVALALNAPALRSRLPIEGLQLQPPIVIVQAAVQGMQGQALLIQRACFGIAGVQRGLPVRRAQKAQGLGDGVVGRCRIV